MEKITIGQTDHDRISAAVKAAEATSDAEIVTVIAQHSDTYHDAGLHYAVAAMLSLLALVAAFPAFFTDIALRWFGGWEHHLPAGFLLTLLLGVQIALFLIVRYALAWMPLRMALTPGATKLRRVRRQAVILFRACAEGRTRGKTAILIYLSLAEHRAEIIGDEAINHAVEPERWGDAMASLIGHMRKGDPGTGMVEAIGLIGTILAKHVPKSEANPNELPDRLIEL